jgi:hypothetical protein
MSLLDAVLATGPMPGAPGLQSAKKRYSEVLSQHLAVQVAEGLRAIGFTHIRPLRGGPGEKAFQGGLGPKKVDVSYADERHGLLLAVSIKTITSAPFGKNLKNRFSDLCTEAVTLHMRFPYSVVCALFAFPAAANEDVTPGRTLSTFARANKLLATISGRQEYTDPDEKFENVSMMLFQPFAEQGPSPWVRLQDSVTRQQLTEQEYFLMLRELYNHRNPHAVIGDNNGSEAEED